MIVPDVSICIPAYEEPAYLVRALESVFDQTYDNFEVIVTDDSRSTALATAVRPWESDPRFRYVRNEQRLGSPENWNRALSLANGRLIKVLHHDDWFARKDSLQQYVALLDGDPGASLAFSAASARNPDGQLLFQHRPEPEQIEALKKDPRCLFLANFVGAPSATLFRREEGFRFDPALKWLVDVEAYLRILRRGTFAYTAEPLVNVTAAGPNRVTRQVERDPALQFLENAYVYKGLGFRRLQRLKYWPLFLEMARRLDSHQLAAVKANPKAKACPFEVRSAIVLQELRLGRWRERAAQSRPSREANQQHRVSYSQCGEDLIIDFIFMWLGLNDVSYIDIGANHPTWLSNTYFFYSKGFRGVLVEPDPDLAKQLSAARPGDRCLNVAVGVDGKDSAKMYVMTSRTLNTLVPTQATEYESYGLEKVEKVIEVPQRDINEIMAAEFDRSPNLVSLDVEGFDLEILKHWDFSRFRPEVFCVETLTFTQNGTERKIGEIADLMAMHGYFAYADTYINTIFVSKAAWNARRGGRANTN